MMMRLGGLVGTYDKVYVDHQIVKPVEVPMATVTVSPKYQVVIPSEVRERLKLKPGQKVAVIEKDGVVHLIPVKPLRSLKGTIPGVSQVGLRDEGNER